MRYFNSSVSSSGATCVTSQAIGDRTSLRYLLKLAASLKKMQAGVSSVHGKETLQAMATTTSSTTTSAAGVPLCVPQLCTQLLLIVYMYYTCTFLLLP